MSWILSGKNVVSLENNFWLPKQPDLPKLLKTHIAFSMFPILDTNLCIKLIKTCITMNMLTLTRQIDGEDFAIFCGLLRKYELYHINLNQRFVSSIGNIEKAMWVFNHLGRFGRSGWFWQPEIILQTDNNLST